VAAPATPDALTSLHQVGTQGGGQRAYGDRCQAAGQHSIRTDNPWNIDPAHSHTCRVLDDLPTTSIHARHPKITCH
jgi:hypothetical protein